MENLVILNDFMTTYVEHELIFYVSDYIEETYPKEDFDEQLNKYMECDYEDHLHYLVETWKKVADENVNVDGNFRNNKLENLSILCPNCHSLTPNHSKPKNK